MSMQCVFMGLFVSIHARGEREGHKGRYTGRVEKESGWETDIVYTPEVQGTPPPPMVDLF